MVDTYISFASIPHLFFIISNSARQKYLIFQQKRTEVGQLIIVSKYSITSEHIVTYLKKQLILLN